MGKKRKTAATTWTMDEIGAYLLRSLTNIAEALRPYQQELLGGTLFLLALLILLNIAGLSSGALPNALGNLSGSLFGWGAIPIVIGLAVLGIKLLSQLFYEDPAPLPMEPIIGVELATAAILALTHLFAGGNDPLTLALEQGGGGFVGWSLSVLLANLLGKWGAGAVFAVIGLAGIGLILSLDGADLLSRFAPMPIPQPAVEAPAEDEEDDTPDPVAKSKPAARPAKRKKPRPPKPSMSADQALQAVGASPGYQKIQLPPLDLLAPPARSSGKSANARYQAQVIEETLNSFGVPAEVVEINRGPTVTQFGVKPGTLTKKLANGTIVEQRVRVSKINSLINDLALALAAAPLRIETPVPGRPIVGIEVPNKNIGLVSLRGSMETEEFEQGHKKGNLAVALGKGTNGGVTTIDLAKQPHLLIAGATGSGKSVCINTIIVSLLMTHTPNELQLLMIDPKMVELVSYNHIPHLIAPVVTDFDQVAGALAWVTREMEHRYKAFAAAGARNINGYNARAAAADRLPYMVVIIDELADLMMLAADEVERYVSRIAQMARATGIHMVIATQRPSTDVVTGLIKANFPARIAFAVSSQIDSRVIIDSPGAEKLLGKGDMLYMSPDSAKLVRLQGCFVSDAEIKNVVTYWKRVAVALAPPVAETKDDTPQKQSAAGQPPAPDKLPWAGLLEEANKDDMLERAINLVTTNQRASTTFLQRKLGIGYPRASRLMDQLEDEGVVGPADSSHVREVLWSDDSADTPSDDALLLDN